MIALLGVLVVEDEALILIDVVEQLEAEGFTVYEASNADRAIELLTEHREIRVLFTDIDMPGSLDGLKLATVVRDRWPPVKIIVTSGARTIDVTSLPEGSVFFSKPYDHSAVMTAIREMTA